MFLDEIFWIGDWEVISSIFDVIFFILGDGSDSRLLLFIQDVDDADEVDCKLRAEYQEFYF